MLNIVKEETLYTIEIVLLQETLYTIEIVLLHV